MDELKKALDSLARVLSEPKSDIARDAAIQRFEFSVELSWKASKKIMGSHSSAPKMIVREMATSGFIDDVTFWLEAIDKRNLSSHTYQEALAEEVYEFAIDFLPEARKLWDRLEKIVGKN